MAINLKSMIKSKNKIPLFLMLKLKMEMIMRMNHHKLMKRLMKKMKLMQEMIINHQIRRMKERNIHLKEVKKEILGYKDQYHILKR
jgi:hypothetical protein